MMKLGILRPLCSFSYSFYHKPLAETNISHYPPTIAPGKHLCLRNKGRDEEWKFCFSQLCLPRIIVSFHCNFHFACYTCHTSLLLGIYCKLLLKMKNLVKYCNNSGLYHSLMMAAIVFQKIANLDQFRECVFLVVYFLRYLCTS
jgi:hypothetical protein